MSSTLPRLLRTAAAALALLLLLGACAGGEDAAATADGLELFDPATFRARLTDSERPTVVNAWGSWCLPCRSEAPLLTEAHGQYGDDVEFLGIAINDTQAGATEFISEFGITYDNLLDPDADVRSELGGIGAPITWFVAPGGEIVDTHIGIIDGAQLAVGIDELLASTS